MLEWKRCGLSARGSRRPRSRAALESAAAPVRLAAAACGGAASGRPQRAAAALDCRRRSRTYPPAPPGSSESISWIRWVALGVSVRPARRGRVAARAPADCVICMVPWHAQSAAAPASSRRWCLRRRLACGRPHVSPKVLFRIPYGSLEVCISAMSWPRLRRICRARLTMRGAPLPIATAARRLAEPRAACLQPLGRLAEFVLGALTAVVLASMLGEVALMLGGPFAAPLPAQPCLSAAAR